jgi:hypothetical protein
MASEEAMVHVHGGRNLLDALAAAGFPGERLEWCDPVSCGPTPAAVSPDRWYEVRAGYLASRPGPLDAAAAESRLREQDRALLAIPPATEIVIWVGPELFCQAVLMRLLVLLGAGKMRRKLSLVDPGDLPGIRGCPLAQLAPPALERIFQQRRPVTDEALALAGRAWAAFTAPEARALVALVAGDTSALPYLGAALSRHLDDLPDGATGLSTTETRLLEILRSGPLPLGGLLSALAAGEARPFLTDVWLEDILGRLGGAEAALVGSEGSRFILTGRGRDVLAGHAFWAAERWHGGILIRENENENENENAEDSPAGENGDGGGTPPRFH